MTFPAKTVFIILLAVFSSTAFLRFDSFTHASLLSLATTTVPAQTDDGQDPINLIFIGYAPSWWVASNIADWSDTAYCSGPKTVDGNPYNSTLEHPDPIGVPCVGPRDHIRIWDMGYSPIFGEWSIASAHHEYTDPLPLPHHVIDSWERAEADVRSAFLGGPATLSVSNYTLANAGYFQGIFNDGNATIIRLSPPSSNYPVVFEEDGLGNRTSWSVTVNGRTTSSPQPDIVLTEPNGTYQFTVNIPSGFNASPSSGTITVSGGITTQNIRFRTPWTTSSSNVNSGGRSLSIDFTSNATVSASTVQLSTGADTTLSFRATELGAIGAVNVTIPKSAAPRDASASVYVDGVRDNNVMQTSDANNYYVYFPLLYGTHSVEMRLVSPSIPYWEYVVGGALAAGILGSLFIAFRMKWKRPRSTVKTPVANSERFHNA